MKYFALVLLVLVRVGILGTGWLGYGLDRYELVWVRVNRQPSGFQDSSDFFRAMRCKRGLCCHAVSVRLSVCLSVTFVNYVKTNKNIFGIFSPSDSDTILVFPSQRGADILTGTPLTGASNARGYDKMAIFSQISRCISERVIDRLAHAARQFVSMWLPPPTYRGALSEYAALAMPRLAHISGRAAWQRSSD